MQTYPAFPAPALTLRSTSYTDVPSYTHAGTRGARSAQQSTSHRRAQDHHSLFDRPPSRHQRSSASLLCLGGPPSSRRPAEGVSPDISRPPCCPAAGQRRQLHRRQPPPARRRPPAAPGPCRPEALLCRAPARHTTLIVVGSDGGWRSGGRARAQAGRDQPRLRGRPGAGERRGSPAGAA
jgi:hypothetical protein